MEIQGRPWGTILLQSAVIGLTVWLGVLQRPAPWSAALLGAALVLLLARLCLLVAVARRGPMSDTGTGRTSPASESRPFAVPMSLLAAGAALLASASSGANDGLGTFPAAVATAIVVADLSVSLGSALALAGTVTLMQCLSVSLAGGSVSQLVNTLFGLGIGIAAGISWRQRALGVRERALAAERELVLRDEARKRSLARDMHDVLAHSLGGLVVQLDAVDLQLEAGSIDEARARVAGARRLAVDGLHEARAAVQALRDDPDGPPVRGAVIGERLSDVARKTGEHLVVSAVPPTVVVSAAAAMTLERAMQEGLANAHKHGAGGIRLRLSGDHDALVLCVENAIAQDGGMQRIPGGGYGLRGLRERVLSLGGGASLRAETVAAVPPGTTQRFVLAVAVPTQDDRA